MTLSRNPQLDMVEKAHLAFSNTLQQPDLLAAAGSINYDEPALNKGLELCQAARNALAEQNIAEGRKEQATIEANRARQAAENAFQVLAGTARAIFLQSPGSLQALGLTGPMPEGTDALIGKARVALEAALKPGLIADELAAAGLDPQDLQNGLEMIQGFDRANQAQENAKAIAQQSTQTKEAVLDALYPYHARFIKLMKVALAGNKQLLEALYVPARTSPTKAQAAARRNY